MCDSSGKLIAWLDHELPENEAADVERHVRSCAECQSNVNAYEEAGSVFDAYCGAVLESKTQRRLPRWTPVLASAAATAAAVGLMLAFWPAPVEKLPLHSPGVAAPPAIAFRGGLTPNTRNPRRRVVAPVQNEMRNREQTEDENWMAAQPAIQIAIPGDAMFPPGAVPEGVSFVAYLNVAADGSAERLHLRP